VTGDLPPATLGELNDPDRNDLVVRTWRERAEAWGKTLVFATNIDHADELTDLFGQAHAQCRVLHSAVTESREEILDWFRSSKESVLVSVGMLMKESTFLMRERRSSPDLRRAESCCSR